jgi:hypothetical protein
MQALGLLTRSSPAGKTHVTGCLPGASQRGFRRAVGNHERLIKLCLELLFCVQSKLNLLGKSLILFFQLGLQLSELQMGANPRFNFFRENRLGHEVDCARFKCSQLLRKLIGASDENNRNILPFRVSLSRRTY